MLKSPHEKPGLMVMSEIKAITDSCAKRDEARLIRLSQCRLVDSGKGLILFGCWNVLKAITYLIYDPMDLKTTVRTIVSDEIGFYVVYLIAILIVVLIDLIPRLIAGFAAVREGRSVWKTDRKEGKVILILIIYLILNSIFSIYSTFMTHSEEVMSYMDQVVINFVVDIITLGIIIEMLLSLLRLRRLLRKRQEGKL